MSPADLPQDLLMLEMLHATLPVGIYMVLPDGGFVYASHVARSLLGIPDDVDIRALNIGTFYDNPADRIECLSVLMSYEDGGGSSPSLEIPLRVRGQRKVFRFYSRSVRDRLSGKPTAFIGCFAEFDSHDLSTHANVLDMVPMGVARTDADGRLVECNARAAMLLGRESPSEIIGSDLNSLVSRIGSTRGSHSEELLEWTQREFVTLLPTGRGALNLCQVSLSPIGPSASLHPAHVLLKTIGGKGSYLQLMTHLPTAAYVVIDLGGVDTVMSCNEAFATLFGHSSSHDIIGVPIKDLHADTSRYNQFLSDLRAAALRGESLHCRREKIATKQGRVFVGEICCGPLVDDSGEIVGRAGTIVDVTDRDDLETNHRILTEDVGDVLHTYSTLLVMTENKAIAALRVLERTLATNRGAESPDDYSQLNHQVDAVLELSLTVLGLAERTAHEQPIEVAEYAQIRLRLAAARSEVQYRELLPPLVLQYVDQLRRAVSQLRFISRHAREQLLLSLRDLENRCASIGLNHLREAVLDMAPQVEALRNYITQPLRPESPKELLVLQELVPVAIRHVVDFARLKRVSLRNESEGVPVTIHGARRDLVGALVNLLHNAVKYSWRRPTAEGAFVDIKCFSEGARAIVRIRNYGVPIPADEIASDKIFEVGFRGRLSTDRNRPGTGIGLPASRRVARRNGGTVVVSSRPAQATASPEDYSVPFITTVELVLPVVSKGEK